MRTVFFSVLISLSGTAGIAQNYHNVVRHRPVFWSELNLVYKTAGKWSFQMDHQYRRQSRDENGRDLNVFRYPLQQVFRPWINYQLTGPVRLSISPIGLWWTWSRPNDFQPYTFFQEVRIIPQLTITKPLPKSELVYRFRSELRWPSSTDTLTSEYVFLSDGESDDILADRFNVRLRAMIRWIKPVFQKNADKTWYVQTSAEPMAVISRTARRFDQSRVYVALGKRLRDNLRVELGYLNQFNLQTDPIQQRRTFRFNHALHAYLYLENRRRTKTKSPVGPE
ncbi:hypothetical protein GGR92_003906 [Spirosoma lacussanchae]